MFALRMSHMSGSVNIAGLLQNMLDSGFSTKDTIGELIDDSLGAGAKTIRISVNTTRKECVFSDDGCGMNEQKLGESHVLHNRTNSSQEKHGRFGIGRKHALSHFTRNASSVKTLSKSEHAQADRNIYELDINYADAVKNNNFPIYPHEIAVSSLELWKKHAIHAAKRGTVTVIQCHVSIMKELSEIITSSDIKRSLQYFIGSTYNEILQTGITIQIVLDDVAHPIVAVDPLCLAKVSDKRKTKIDIQRNVATGDVSAFFTHAGKYVNRRINTVTGKYKNFTDVKATEWVKVGELILLSSYSSELMAMQSDALKAMHLSVIEQGGAGVHEQFEALGGRYIVRNGKVVSRFSINKPTSGDKGRYDYVTGSRHVVQFCASEILDDCFKVMVNKSKLIEDNINADIWQSVIWLCESFSSDCYKKYYKEVPTPVTSLMTPPPAKIEHIPANAFGAKLKEAKEPTPETKPKPEPKPETKPKPETEPKPELKIVEKVAPVPIAPIAPVIITPPVPDIVFSKSDTHVIITEHNRPIHKIAYVGQYNVTEKYLDQILLHIGKDRFKEYLTQLTSLNNYLQHQ